MSEPNAAPHPDGEELPHDESADRPDTPDVTPEGMDDGATSEPGRPASAGGDDTDAQFASIVAHLVQDPTWAGSAPDAAVTREPVRFPTAPGVRPLGPRDHHATEEVLELEDEQSHFVPPEPPPLLGGDPLITMGWIAVLLTPLSLFATIFGPRPTPTLWLQLTAGVLILGVAVLVWRMPHRRDPDHAPDDQV